MATYKELFKVSFKHDYYRSGVTADFSVRPSKNTAVKMKGLKLLFKPGLTGFKVLYLQDDETELPKMDISGHDFEFHLFLNDPLFLNFTELVDGYRKTVISNFDNGSGDGELDETSIAMSSDLRVADVFAVITISDVDSTGSDYPLVYNTQWTAMSRLWHYYVVVPQDYDLELAINDTEITFSDTVYPELTFDNGEEVMIGDELRAIHFTSESMIKTYQEAKTKLSLCEGEGTDKDVKIESLPNPEVKDLNSTVYVYI